MKIAGVLYCMPRLSGHCLADAPAALLLLEVVLRSCGDSVSQRCAWRWLAVLLLRSPVEQLGSFAQVAAPYLVASMATLCEQAVTSQQSEVWYTARTPLLAVLAIICPSGCIATAGIKDHEGIHERALTTQAEPIALLVSVGDGALFAALERLLRACRPGGNDGKAVATVLLAMCSDPSALGLLMEQQRVAMALAALAVSMGKWLRMKEVSDDWTCPPQQQLDRTHASLQPQLIEVDQSQMTLQHADTEGQQHLQSTSDEQRGRLNDTMEASAVASASSPHAQHRSSRSNRDNGIEDFVASWM